MREGIPGTLHTSPGSSFQYCPVSVSCETWQAVNSVT